MLNARGADDRSGTSALVLPILLLLALLTMLSLRLSHPCCSASGGE